MKKQILVLTLTSMLLSSCGSSTSSSSIGKQTVTDMSGRQLELDLGSYHKIVCIGGGALRLYSYVGDNASLAGVEDIDNTSLSSRPKMFDSVARPYLIANEDAYKLLPSCGVGGPNAQAAEAEKILSCDPDLILSEYSDVDKANALQEEVGVPVVTLSYGSKGVFDDSVKTSLKLIGKILGKEAKAETLCDYIDSQKEEISKLTANLNSQKKVYICGLGNWGTTNHLMTWQNYEPFNVAHIQNAVTDLAKDGCQALTEEKFVSVGEEADVMIIDAAALKNIKPLYQKDPTMFDTVKAWQTGEVYLQMAYNAYYTNLEIALANTWYNAKVAHSEVKELQNLDMDKKLNEITKQFLGKELASEIRQYSTSANGYSKITPEMLSA